MRTDVPFGLPRTRSLRRAAAVSAIAAPPTATATTSSARTAPSTPFSPARPDAALVIGVPRRRRG